MLTPRSTQDTEDRTLRITGTQQDGRAVKGRLWRTCMCTTGYVRGTGLEKDKLDLIPYTHLLRAVPPESVLYDIFYVLVLAGPLSRYQGLRARLWI